MLTPRFKPGRLVVTAGAMLALQESGLDPAFFVEKHVCGDWGEQDESNRRINEIALETGGRVVSCFRTPLGRHLGVVTPGDRSATVILELPEAC